MFRFDKWSAHGSSEKKRKEKINGRRLTCPQLNYVHPSSEDKFEISKSILNMTDHNI